MTKTRLGSLQIQKSDAKKPPKMAVLVLVLVVKPTLHMINQPSSKI